jgi:adenylylsulfate kinase-like enzyme
LKNFTGIDSPYEAPEHPEVHLRPGEGAPESCVEELFAALS